MRHAIFYRQERFLCEIVIFSRNVMVIKTNFCPRFLLISVKQKSSLEIVADNTLIFLEMLVKKKIITSKQSQISYFSCNA